MQKVYLLLRNNHQSGPFSVDELLQHDLKPTDLVWEEGKSFGWSFPYEITSLKPFFKAPVQSEHEVVEKKFNNTEPISSDIDMDAPFASKSVTSKNVYVSLPHDSLHRESYKQEHPVEESIEQKAEAIRRRALAAAEQGISNTERKSFENPYELETKLSRTPSEIGEDYSAWLYTQQIEKKRKARKRKSFLMGASSVLVVAFVLFFYRGMITSSNLVNAETQPIQDNKQEQVVPMNISRQLNTSEAVTSEMPAEFVDSSNVKGGVAGLPVKKEKVTTTSVPKPAFDSQKVAGSVPDSDAIVGIHEEARPVQNTDSEQVRHEKIATEVAEAPKKKESFGSKIGSFFEKFKSKEKRNRTEKSNTKTEESQNERSDKRSEQAQRSVDIAHFISISSNAPAENWMVGVQGLKLTLHNKSNETVKTAAVEVRYYNEDKELLEKKVVQFNNISPKTSQTVPAPDHRLAERADYHLISASPKEDGYVKQ